ncbi:helix-turn-helix domain-containing protein [Microvirga brassicacearum]|uniref:Helix-turn-helix domain-containing protein n=1 Tax=Microvirga brassicacearum TaxID=2580413 RepID=A0A5N3PB91_9HYPH|nr:helix-turn-helix domain-containing protein [Microvirga brassicacearum]
MLAPVSFFDTKSVRDGDRAVLNQKVSVRQLKAARALLGWSQADLARSSGVSEPTIKRLEAGDGALGGRSDTGDKLQDALQRAGIVFFFENEASQRGGPGVRVKSSHTDEGLRPEQLTSENDG